MSVSQKSDFSGLRNDRFVLNAELVLGALLLFPVERVAVELVVELFSLREGLWLVVSHFINYNYLEKKLRNVNFVWQRKKNFDALSGNPTNSETRLKEISCTLEEEHADFRIRTIAQSKRIF